MGRTLKRELFSNINLDDAFFDSLKAQYGEFPVWFAGKAEQGAEAYIVYDADNDELSGFLYLKLEEGEINDVDPPLPAARRIKVGTFKIDARGTRLGERVLKKIFDHALSESVSEIYVTVFDTHERLIALFTKYGFEERGTKETDNGIEKVLVRDFNVIGDDIVKNYPFFRTLDKDKYLLAVYPDYHTKLFPDSILQNEDARIVEDVSHTNTIHKVYIAKMVLTRMSPGDLVIIYRTTDKPGLARFRSVATTVCVVEEVKKRRDFADVDSFLAFAGGHSIFTENELRERYDSGERFYACRLTYNAAFQKRPIRGVLLDDVGIPVQPRWDLKQITDDQFHDIIELGEVNESLVVD